MQGGMDPPAMVDTAQRIKGKGLSSNQQRQGCKQNIDLLEFENVGGLRNKSRVPRICNDGQQRWEKGQQQHD